MSCLAFYDTEMTHCPLNDTKIVVTVQPAEPLQNDTIQQESNIPF